MRFAFVCCFLLSFFQKIYGQHLIEIKGTITDSLTAEPLPYASVNVVNKHLGTVSDFDGNFNFKIPTSLHNQQVVFSFLGYHSVYITIDTFHTTPYAIKMSRSAVELLEIEVNSLTPTELIQRFISKIPINYPDSAFVSNGFYKELLKENGHFVKYVEAYVSSYNFPYTDTTTSQTKLLEGRTRNDLKELQFMRDKIEKEKKKEEKNAKKHNKPFNKEDYEAIKLSFSNPNLILKADPARDLDPFMKEENFDKFTFWYGPLSTLADKKLIAIGFKQEKKIEHMMVSGTIYLDAESDALVRVDLAGEFYIPTLIKPILFLLGMKFTNPKFHKMVEYREIDRFWYLNKIHLDAKAIATKKKWFKPKQEANFEFENSLVINHIKTKNISPFAPSELMTNDPIEKQLGPYNEAFWKKHDSDNSYQE